MKRLLAVAVGFLCVATAAADIAPPRGVKRVPLEYKVETERAYPDYTFFAISGGDKAQPVKLDPKTPAKVTAGGGRYRVAMLVAVPKDAAKSFPNDKAFTAAVASGKVPGLIRTKTPFYAFTDLKDSDTRKVVVQRYKVDKVDAREGIVLVQVKDAKCDADEDDGTPVENPEVPLAAAPKGKIWVAGASATLAVMLTGLWLARRTRGPRAGA